MRNSKESFYSNEQSLWTFVRIASQSPFLEIPTTFVSSNIKYSILNLLSAYFGLRICSLEAVVITSSRYIECRYIES